MPIDYRNGHQSVPEVDRFMTKLLAYDETHYHAPDADRPRMVPMGKWVKPNGIVPVFPGGPGMHGSRFPRHGIMVLMQDFDSESGYLRAVEHGYTRDEDVTCVTVVKVLSEAGISLNDCYFTNRFVGVRDADDQFGENPGWVSPNSKRQYKPYVAMSDTILKMQLVEQAPRLVLTCGTHVPRSLGFSSLWSNKLIEFASILGHDTVVAALVHPSFRPSNIGRIRWGEHVGHQAEIELIKHALRVAGLRTLSALPD